MINLFFWMSLQIMTSCSCISNGWCGEKVSCNNDVFISPVIFDKLLTSNLIWFESWNWKIDTISNKNFYKIWEKNFEVEWTKCDFNKEYQYPMSMFLTMDNKDIAIDMYSYSMLTKIKNDSIIVGFDVDTKVFLIDIAKNIKAELLMTGSYEILEDAFILNKESIYIYGYLNESKGKLPFILELNIKKQKQYLFCFNYLQLESRDIFFLKKYPNTSFE